MSTTIYLPRSMLDSMSIGDRIRALRKEAGLTQQQMADIVGTTKQYVSQLESGRNQTPNGVYLEGWSRRFGVNTRWLSTGEGPMAAPDIPVYQSVRLEPATLAETLDFLDRTFGALGRKFDIRAETELFVDVYEWLAVDNRPADQLNLVDFAAWKARRNSNRGVNEQDEGQGNTDGTDLVRGSTG